MSMVGCRNDAISLADVRDLTDALMGAFAEGVNLGPRGVQIRSLGQSLEADVEALRALLADLGVQEGVDGAPSDFDGVIRLAHAARNYGIDGAE